MYEKRDQRGIDLPCPRPDAIEGDGPIQYCARCDSAVYDFSALSADEAEALETANAQRTFCARVQFDGRKRRHRAPSSLRTVGLALGLGLGGLVVAQWVVRQGPESPGGGVIGPSGVHEHGPAALRKSVNAAIDAAARSTTPAPKRLTALPHHLNAQHAESMQNAKAAIERGPDKTSASTRHHPPPGRLIMPGTMAPRNTPVSGGIPPPKRRVSVGSTAPRVHADVADLLSGGVGPAPER